MKHLILLFTLWALTSCYDSLDEKTEQHVQSVVVYRDRPHESIANIAYELLHFEKYKEALDIVQDDTSLTSLTVKIIANNGLGNTREAIDYAIQDLRSKDTTRFYEGSWELWNLYLIFKKDIDYGLKRLNEEYLRCHSNYQVRQLMMKLYWYLEDYEMVVALGDEFRKELPDMPQEVTFNFWRQDALDSLAIKSPDTYNEILESYKPKPWNGVEVENDKL